MRSAHRRLGHRSGRGAIGGNFAARLALRFRGDTITHGRLLRHHRAAWRAVHAGRTCIGTLPAGTDCCGWQRQGRQHQNQSHEFGDTSPHRPSQNYSAFELKAVILVTRGWCIQYTRIRVFSNLDATRPFWLVAGNRDSNPRDRYSGCSAQLNGLPLSPLGFPSSGHMRRSKVQSRYIILFIVTVPV